MTLDELADLCREAARDLAGQKARPLPAAVVLPRSDATEIVTLPGFPAGDDARAVALADVADERMRPRNVPCYGFLAEAELSSGGDVLLVAYGARGQGARLTAAPFEEGALGAFVDDEPVAHGALPFLAPLQAAADAAGPPDVTAVR